MLGPVSGPGEQICSARDCRALATWALLWNNPTLHSPDRRKAWLACDAHGDSLAAHLSVRGFLRDRVPVGDLPQD